MKSRYLLSLALIFLFSAPGVRSQQTQNQKIQNKEAPSKEESGKANPQAAPEPKPPAIGDQAPDFTLKVLDSEGKAMQLSSLKGKAVLVNFWATWCEPCKFEMPWLIDLQKKYGPQGLQIVGISMDGDDEAGTISEFAHKMKVNYPVLIGTEKVADTYGGVDGLPMSFFLDRSGKITGRIMGLVSESDIEDAIKKSLDQGGSSTASTSK